jgi:hypothetical protein
MISPSGMTLAGKYGTGVLSIGSMSTAGLQALPTQWGFAEDSAAKHGNAVNRDDWRVVLSWHLAETKKQAQEEAKRGLLRWHNEYTVGTLMRPGAVAYDNPDQAIEEMSGGDNAMAIIGTPDELIDTIRKLQALTGGFGTVIGFVNDWANPEATMRSWDMVARYVIPEVNGMLDGYRESQAHVINNREVFDRAGEVGERTIGHADVIALLELDTWLRLGRAFLDLLLDRRDLPLGDRGWVATADEAIDLRCVLDQVPGLVGEVHLDEDITRIESPGAQPRLSAATLLHVLLRDQDVPEVALHTRLLDALLEGELHFVLVARIGLNDIPLHGHHTS